MAMLLLAGLALIPAGLWLHCAHAVGGDDKLPAAAGKPARERGGGRGGLRIVVTKQARQLVLFSGAKAIRTYRVGLGFNPTGAKTRKGDGRTPEGDYYVCGKNPRSAFYLSLALSYPNVDDARRGRRERRITEAQYSKIARAIRRRRQPPWDTPLGGEIFIHGNGAQSDWTLGCIALEDQDIRELYRRVPVGTRVRITP